MARPALPASVPAGASLGMVETLGLVASIEAADAMLKAADVRLVSKEKVVPGLISHVVVGETAAVQSAVDAGVAAAARIGKVFGSLVIARPSDDVWRAMLGITLGGDAVPSDTEAPARPAQKRASATPTEARAEDPEDADDPAGGPPDGPVPASAPPERDYAAMTVRTLRGIIRDRDDVALEGRAVASAVKDDLVDALRAADAQGAEA